MGKIVDIYGPPKCTVCGRVVEEEPALVISEMIGFESRYDGHKLHLVFCEEHADDFLMPLAERYGEGIFRNTQFVTGE